MQPHDVTIDVPIVSGTKHFQFWQARPRNDYYGPARIMNDSLHSVILLGGGGGGGCTMDPSPTKWDFFYFRGGGNVYLCTMKAMRGRTHWMDKDFALMKIYMHNSFVVTLVVPTSLIIAPFGATATAPCTHCGIGDYQLPLGGPHEQGDH